MPWIGNNYISKVLTLSTIVLLIFILIVVFGTVREAIFYDLVTSEGDGDDAGFRKDVAAYALLDGFSQRGSAVNLDLLGIYRQRLVERFPTESDFPAEMVPNAGIALNLKVFGPDLYDDEKGIFANPAGRGMNWERPGLVSFFEDGQLLFESRVGVRIHGSDWARSIKAEDLGYRLYFRSAYDSAEIAAGLVWSGAHWPLSRLVILRMSSSFKNAIGLDISRRLGLPTPLLVPARFYLNGEFVGVRLLTEHVGQDFLSNHFGNADFEFFRFKENWESPLWASFFSFPDRLAEAGELNLNNVSKYINIDALFKQYILYLLIEDYDNYQGMVLREREKKDSTWKFVIWDLQGGMQTGWARDIYYKKHPERTKEFISHLGIDSAQSKIWRGLSHDTEFRWSFAKAALDSLNYDVSEGWLDLIISEYREKIKFFNIRNDGEIEKIHQFLVGRRERIFDHIENEWKLAPLHEVQIDLGSSVKATINGHPVGETYRGRYMEGTRLEIHFEDDHAVIDHIEINGKKHVVIGKAFDLEVERPTHLRVAIEE